MIAVGKNGWRMGEGCIYAIVCRLLPVLILCFLDFVYSELYSRPIFL